MKNSMIAVITKGSGDFDQMDIREIPVPEPREDEVLIRVLAAGINNTEINTRLGWYASSVTTSTADFTNSKDSISADENGGWGAATPFPLIQGTDCCGIVIKTGSNKSHGLLNKRVIVRPCMLSLTKDGYTPWFGSDCNGAFAQYAVAPVKEVYPVLSDWSDCELASIPCAYGTAENLISQIAIKKGDKVLISGASGGVGSAAVQLAQLRGAEVYGISGLSKAGFLEEMGVKVIARGTNLVESLGVESIDSIVDLVGGEYFPQFLEVLKRFGKYVTSGAIGGPVVELDLRKLYLKDLRMTGHTAWNQDVFSNLINYIEEGLIRPLVRKTYPLEEIINAQKDFLKKEHFGKMVLIP